MATSLVRRVGRFLGLNGAGPLDTEPPVRPTDALDDLIKQRVWNTGFGPSGGNLSGESPTIRARYREHLREPFIKAALLSKVWDVGSLTLGMTPDDPQSERDKTIAEFARDNIANSVGGVRSVVESITIGALMDGYGLCHKRSKTQDRGKWAGRLMLDVLRPKDSQYFDLVFDDFRNITAVRDRYPAREDMALLPPGDFVIVRHLSIFDSPYGMSDLRAADRAYCCIDAATKLRGIYLDKYIGPFLVGKYSDPTVRGDLGASLKEGRAGGWITVPKECDLEVISLAMGSEESFKSAIADWQQEIAISITGAFLQMTAGQVPGGAGRTDQHAKQAKLVRWYLARLVCDTLDAQITPEYVDANFAGSPAYPKATLEGLDPAEILADLQVGELLLGMGLDLSKKEVRARSGYGPPEDDADTLVQAAPADPFAGLPGGDGEFPALPPALPPGQPKALPAADEGAGA
jgi:hypothetical protein